MKKAINKGLKKLSSKLGKPNFSNFGEIRKHDYYGLMGGTQNIEIDFKITSTSNGEYNLETTMNINDWYGADADDINKRIDYKNIAITTAYAMSHPTDYANIDNYKKIWRTLKRTTKV